MDSTSATFLHVTDAHIAYAGTVLERDDRKNPVVGLPAQTRETALRQVFERLAEQLKREGRTLDGVIFSGDAQDRGRQGGHELLLHLLLNYFGPFGITEERIVATPGNHDVDRAYDPGTAERYKDFCATWRDHGCVVPWIDGVDVAGPAARHSLVDVDGRWAIFPINSSNWCHAAAVLPEPLATVWSRLPQLAAGGNKEIETELQKQLDALARYDMARVINRARDLGFSIEQIKDLLSLWGDRSRASADVKAIALEHVSALETKARAIDDMSKTLRHLAESCNGDDRPDCPIIDGFAEAAPPAQARERKPRFGRTGTPRRSHSP